MQNAAARLLTRTKLFDHITPILASLHWLPLYCWILLLTYKALNGLAPELLRSYEKGSCLRSSFKELLAVPRTRYKTKEVTYGHISSAHTHTHSSEHTHHEHTPRAVGSQLCCGARGAVGDSFVVLKVERVLYIHSPHLQSLPTRDSNS